jgi:hypothetical protein
MQFTKSALTAMTLPEGKADHVVWDDDLPGFGLRLRGDTRRWVVQYRIGGQSRRRKPVVRPSTHAAIMRDLKLHWAPLAKRSIAAIKRADIAARLGEITRDNGRSAAARARASLSAMYGWAMREGLCEANPVVSTNNPGEGAKPRDRVLADDKLRAIWRACGEEDFGRIASVC